MTRRDKVMACSKCLNNIHLFVTLTRSEIEIFSVYVIVICITYLTTANRLDVHYQDKSGGQRVAFHTSHRLNTAAWQHIWIDISDSEIRILLNGYPKFINLKKSDSVLEGDIYLGGTPRCAIKYINCKFYLYQIRNMLTLIQYRDENRFYTFVLINMTITNSIIPKRIDIIIYSKATCKNPSRINQLAISIYFSG